MQEPADLGPPSAVVVASVVSSLVLGLIDFAVLVFMRHQLDPKGGIFAVATGARNWLTGADVEASQPSSDRQRCGPYFTHAKLFDSLLVSQILVSIAAAVLCRYDWSLALALGIHTALSQVSWEHIKQGSF